MKSECGACNREAISSRFSRWCVDNQAVGHEMKYFRGIHRHHHEEQAGNILSCQAGAGAKVVNHTFRVGEQLNIWQDRLRRGEASINIKSCQWSNLSRSAHGEAARNQCVSMSLIYVVLRLCATVYYKESWPTHSEAILSSRSAAALAFHHQQNQQPDAASNEKAV